MFQLLDDRKRGKSTRDVASLVNTALVRSESLFHTDQQKGLQYFRIAYQHYENLDPRHPDYKWIEFRLGTLFVDYFKTQTNLI